MCPSAAPTPPTARSFVSSPPPADVHDAAPQVNLADQLNFAQQPTPPVPPQDSQSDEPEQGDGRVVASPEPSPRVHRRQAPVPTSLAAELDFVSSTGSPHQDEELDAAGLSTQPSQEEEEREAVVSSLAPEADLEVPDATSETLVCGLD